MAQTQNYTKLQKKARAKYLTRSIIYPLLSLKKSSLLQSYYNTYHCATQIVKEGNKITSKYCGNRWCLVCNRINTAKNINAYGEQINQFIDAYFLTLTIKNIDVYGFKKYQNANYLKDNDITLNIQDKSTADPNSCTDQDNSVLFNAKKFYKNKLKATYYTMFAEIEKIRNLAKKTGHSIKAVIKFETTINMYYGELHPHLHMIIEGKDNTEYILNQWRKRFKDVNDKAQDLQKVDQNSNYELFKYMSKSLYKVSGKYVNPYKYQDYIYKELRGLRLFRVWGVKKMQISENIDGIISQLVQFENEPTNGVYTYSKDAFDWVHIGFTDLQKCVNISMDKSNSGTFETLSGYTPSSDFVDLNKQVQMKYHQNKIHNR